MKISKIVFGIIIFLSAVFLSTIIFRPEVSVDITAYENFLSELGNNGYQVKVENVGKDILAGERKWLTVNDKEYISVYLYDSSVLMEEDARRISPDGCTYGERFRETKISWVSKPHFYKQTNMIVLYVGENKDIVNDLEQLFGKQFAGYGFGTVIDNQESVLPRLALSYYFLLAAGITVVSTALWLLLKNRKTVRQCISKVFMLTGSYMIGQLSYKGIRFSTYTLQMDLIYILLRTIFIYLVLLILTDVIFAKTMSNEY